MVVRNSWPLPRARTPMVLVAQPMDLIGTIVGDGDQAPEVDGVMVQARLGHLQGLEGVMALGLGQGQGQGQVSGMVMEQEMMVLMVVAMELEAEKATLAAAALVVQAQAGSQVKKSNCHEKCSYGVSK